MSRNRVVNHKVVLDSDLNGRQFITSTLCGEQPSSNSPDGADEVSIQWFFVFANPGSDAVHLLRKKSTLVAELFRIAGVGRIEFTMVDAVVDAKVELDGWTLVDS